MASGIFRCLYFFCFFWSTHMSTSHEICPEISPVKQWVMGLERRIIRFRFVIGWIDAVRTVSFRNWGIIVCCNSEPIIKLLNYESSMSCIACNKNIQKKMQNICIVNTFTKSKQAVNILRHDQTLTARCFKGSYLERLS